MKRSVILSLLGRKRVKYSPKEGVNVAAELVCTSDTLLCGWFALAMVVVRLLRAL